MAPFRTCFVVSITLVLAVCLFKAAINGFDHKASEKLVRRGSCRLLQTASNFGYRRSAGPCLDIRCPLYDCCAEDAQAIAGMVRRKLGVLALRPWDILASGKAQDVIVRKVLW